MKIENPKQIEFICPICKATEKTFDADVPPRFDCEKCYGKMVPKFYIGVNSKKYFYNDSIEK